MKGFEYEGDDAKHYEFQAKGGSFNDLLAITLTGATVAGSVIAYKRFVVDDYASKVHSKGSSNPLLNTIIKNTGGSVTSRRGFNQQGADIFKSNKFRAMLGGAGNSGGAVGKMDTMDNAFLNLTDTPATTRVRSIMGGALKGASGMEVLYEGHGIPERPRLGKAHYLVFNLTKYRDEKSAKEKITEVFGEETVTDNPKLGKTKRTNFKLTGIGHMLYKQDALFTIAARKKSLGSKIIGISYSMHGEIVGDKSKKLIKGIAIPRKTALPNDLKVIGNSLGRSANITGRFRTLFGMQGFVPTIVKGINSKGKIVKISFDDSIKSMLRHGANLVSQGKLGIEVSEATSDSLIGKGKYTYTKFVKDVLEYHQSLFRPLREFDKFTHYDIGPATQAVIPTLSQFGGRQSLHEAMTTGNFYEGLDKRLTEGALGEANLADSIGPYSRASAALGSQNELSYGVQNISQIHKAIFSTHNLAELVPMGFMQGIKDTSHEFFQQARLSYSKSYIEMISKEFSSEGLFMTGRNALQTEIGRAVNVASLGESLPDRITTSMLMLTPADSASARGLEYMRAGTIGLSADVARYTTSTRRYRQGLPITTAGDNRVGLSLYGNPKSKFTRELYNAHIQQFYKGRDVVSLRVKRRSQILAEIGHQLSIGFKYFGDKGLEIKKGTVMFQTGGQFADADADLIKVKRTIKGHKVTNKVIKFKSPMEKIRAEQDFRFVGLQGKISGIDYDREAGTVTGEKIGAGLEMHGHMIDSGLSRGGQYSLYKDHVSTDVMGRQFMDKLTGAQPYKVGILAHSGATKSYTTAMGRSVMKFLETGGLVEGLLGSSENISDSISARHKKFFIERFEALGLGKIREDGGELIINTNRAALEGLGEDGLSKNARQFLMELRTEQIRTIKGISESHGTKLKLKLGHKKASQALRMLNLGWREKINIHGVGGVFAELMVGQINKKLNIKEIITGMGRFGRYDSSHSLKYGLSEALAATRYAPNGGHIAANIASIISGGTNPRAVMASYASRYSNSKFKDIISSLGIHADSYLDSPTSRALIGQDHVVDALRTVRNSRGVMISETFNAMPGAIKDIFDMNRGFEVDLPFMYKPQGAAEGHMTNKLFLEPISTIKKLGITDSDNLLDQYHKKYLKILENTYANIPLDEFGFKEDLDQLFRLQASLMGSKGGYLNRIMSGPRFGASGYVNIQSSNSLGFDEVKRALSKTEVLEGGHKVPLEIDSLTMFMSDEDLASSLGIRKRNPSYSDFFNKLEKLGPGGAWKEQFQPIMKNRETIGFVSQGHTIRYPFTSAGESMLPTQHIFLLKSARDALSARAGVDLGIVGTADIHGWHPVVKEERGVRYALDRFFDKASGVAYTSDIMTFLQRADRDWDTNAFFLNEVIDAEGRINADATRNVQSEYKAWRKSLAPRIDELEKAVFSEWESVKSPLIRTSTQRMGGISPMDQFVNFQAKTVQKTHTGRWNFFVRPRAEQIESMLSNEGSFAKFAGPLANIFGVDTSKVAAGAFDVMSLNDDMISGIQKYARGALASTSLANMEQLTIAKAYHGLSFIQAITNYDTTSGGDDFMRSFININLMSNQERAEALKQGGKNKHIMTIAKTLMNITAKHFPDSDINRAVEDTVSILEKVTTGTESAYARTISENQREEASNALLGMYRQANKNMKRASGLQDRFMRSLIQTSKGKEITPDIIMATLKAGGDSEMMMAIKALMGINDLTGDMEIDPATTRRMAAAANAMQTKSNEKTAGSKIVGEVVNKFEKISDATGGAFKNIKDYIGGVMSGNHTRSSTAAVNLADAWLKLGNWRYAIPAGAALWGGAQVMGFFSKAPVYAGNEQADSPLPPMNPLDRNAPTPPVIELSGNRGQRVISEPESNISGQIYADSDNPAIISNALSSLGHGNQRVIDSRASYNSDRIRHHADRMDRSQF